ncbi:ARHGEF3 isoform 1 [Pan troglodytes]|uniref:ARHGEF3 isoform 1 n=1 Tax=Pan troglodytes TaxID=9598 RepID=A0A2J8P7X7_PANTR|nr:ARHGEF3 isoform 1 [Pan troglodytes]
MDSSTAMNQCSCRGMEGNKERAVGGVSGTSAINGRNNWFFRLLRKSDLCG